MIRACLLICLVCWSGHLFAQNLELQQSIDSLTVDYLRLAGKQSALYYGKEQEWYLRASNHPYLKDEQYTKARLSYNRVVYPEVLLRLDVNRNELVTLSPNRRNIVLCPENVDFAEMHGRRIIYFQHDNLPACPPSGYYMLLFSGNCKVLEKRNASLIEKITSTGLERHFELSTQFFLYKDGVYYHIKNKNRLLKALVPYRKELKRFISVHRLRFSRNPEELLIRTVSEYEKLSGNL